MINCFLRSNRMFKTRFHIISTSVSCDLSADLLKRQWHRRNQTKEEEEEAKKQQFVFASCSLYRYTFYAHFTLHTLKCMRTVTNNIHHSFRNIFILVSQTDEWSLKSQRNPSGSYFFRSLNNKFQTKKWLFCVAQIMISILVTGCSRGIGLGLIKVLLNSPNSVKHLIATCRHPEQALVNSSLLFSSNP